MADGIFIKKRTLSDSCLKNSGPVNTSTIGARLWTPWRSNGYTAFSNISRMDIHWMIHVLKIGHTLEVHWIPIGMRWISNEDPFCVYSSSKSTAYSSYFHLMSIKDSIYDSSTRNPMFMFKRQAIPCSIPTQSDPSSPHFLTHCPLQITAAKDLFQH